MRAICTLLGLSLVSAVIPASAQDPGQVELRIEPANRTLTVSAEGQASVEPEIAVLQIGFETQLGDAQAVYADGARTSNAIIAALKQAGIPEASIRSQFQHLDRDATKPHKFKLVQQWSVRAPAERAAEILDVAITAGATSSGDIDWTVKDEQALEHQALAQATQRARDTAEVLAKGMGVRLGTLIYVSNQSSGLIFPRATAMHSFAQAAGPPQPLAIEPTKVSRSASVRAIYSIE